MNYVPVFHLNQGQGTFFLDLGRQLRPKAIPVFGTKYGYVSMYHNVYRHLVKLLECLPVAVRLDNGLVLPMNE
jgi:hypothetical protein